MATTLVAPNQSHNAYLEIHLAGSLARGDCRACTRRRELLGGGSNRAWLRGQELGKVKHLADPSYRALKPLTPGRRVEQYPPR